MQPVEQVKARRIQRFKFNANFGFDIIPGMDFIRDDDPQSSLET
jgi:hypothetical protein